MGRMITASGARVLSQTIIAERGDTATAREKLARVATKAATRAAGRNSVIVCLQDIRVCFWAVSVSGRLKFQIDLFSSRA
jgi:hypothetical protein